mmetsp:Transcript_27889/g.58912  ORF Transcript_27889/g.58912 Transcript_27889/m.58912 type:complete len:441 (-) Transcript_27889:92-1414(-)|eukprot:CAMPEP_0183718946 /NCGR_PEP_ID=MMETSP0737-20130205/12059_1 /TAXON_ID=385413 /ORGANISM="Thalassiosira miniscula, Strain CCMP1093" /LENGTH=440 /DNA_ID=CAMNT_0025948599 /DNA_START=127 /DNA_END=1449 /DNA_ORIENTATION=+
MTMATHTTHKRRRGHRLRHRPRRSLYYYIYSSLLFTTALLAISCIVLSQETETVAGETSDESDATTEEVVVDVDYGNHNNEWEDGPSSWEEFGHDNDPEVCGVPVLTVEEWESGKYWEGSKPVIVKNVTEGWAALNHWKLQEMLRRYPDAEATMGDGRRVGEYGPDEAGNILTPTTVKEFIKKHMYNPFKYFFDRKIAIPNGMLQDCHPFPMPTRTFLEDPTASGIYALSKKRKVDPRPDYEIWQDHLAISIGSDLQGLSFHFHGEAWNVVLFGKKRWLLWDHERFRTNVTRQRRFALAGPDADILSSPEWIRQLYPHPERMYELRNHGHDCIQHENEMMFVPRKWMHMVVNIGDTVSVISEVGLEKGEGKTEEDFAYDPDEESSDDDEYDSEDGYWNGSYGQGEDDSSDDNEGGMPLPPWFNRWRDGYPPGQDGDGTKE